MWICYQDGRLLFPRTKGGGIELIFVDEVIHRDGLLDDGQEIVIILQVKVCLFVFFQHQVAHPHVVLQFLLAVYPVLEQRL